MCVSVLQMNLDFPDLLDLAHDLPGWRYKWTCDICLINAKAGFVQLKPNQFTVVEAWREKRTRVKGEHQPPALQENGIRTNPMRETN